MYLVILIMLVCALAGLIAAVILQRIAAFASSDWCEGQLLYTLVCAVSVLISRISLVLLGILLGIQMFSGEPLPTHHKILWGFSGTLSFALTSAVCRWREGQERTKWLNIDLRRLQEMRTNLRG